MMLHTPGYILFAFCCFLGWGNSCYHWIAPDEMPYSYGLAAHQARLPRARIAAVIVSSAIFVPILLLFVLDDAHRAHYALAIIAMLWTIRQFEVRTWDGDKVKRWGKYAPAAVALVGYLVGRLFAGWDHAPHMVERYGWEGAAGVMGGAMCLAGIQKIRKSGLVFFEERGLGLMLAERLYFGPAPIRKLRRLLLDYPNLVAALGGIAIFFELGAAAFWFPAIREIATVLMVATMVPIMILLGYLEFEWLLVYVAVGWISVALAYT